MEKALTLQERIDAIAYPPTHQYRLDPLVPQGDLAARAAVIDAEFPGFFASGNLLDVGCNKGFFLLTHKGFATGIDPDPACVSLCRDLGSNAVVEECSFGGFDAGGRTFEKIFIGNGPHYPFIEAQGWSWVDKLAAISVGEVLLEGPVDMSGRDAKRCIPEHLVALFNEEARYAAFCRTFWLRKQVRSPLVDRYFTLWEKKDDLVHAPMARYAEYLRHVYRQMASFIGPYDSVMEICTRHDRGTITPEHIGCDSFHMVDRDPKRPGLDLDAVVDDLPACDVAISTAILHHTPKAKIPALLANIAKHTRKTMIFTGPAADRMTELVGDHEYHIDPDEIAAMTGWTMTRKRRIGLSEPFCEWFIVLEKETFL